VPTEKDPWDFSDFGEQSAGSSPALGAPPSSPQNADRSAADGGNFGIPTAQTDSQESVPLIFDQPTHSATAVGGLSVAGPPLTWLGASAAAAVIGLLLAALLGALPPLAVTGWVLAGPVAIGALAVYTSADTRRRARPVYISPNWLTAAYYACLGVCLVGVVVAAIRIALWVGRW